MGIKKSSRMKLIWLFSGLAVAKPDWLTYDDEKHSVQALWTRCPYLKLPKNGKGIHCYLDICRLECKKDYVLIGKEKLKCKGKYHKHSFKWKGKMGQCVKICKDLNMPEHIHQKCKSKKKKPKKKSCTYSCVDPTGVFDLGGEALISQIKTKCQCMEDENGDVSCNYVPKSIGTGTTIQAGFFTQESIDLMQCYTPSNETDDGTGGDDGSTDGGDTGDEGEDDTEDTGGASAGAASTSGITVGGIEIGVSEVSNFDALRMMADVVDPSNGIQTYIEGMTGEIAEWDAELQAIAAIGGTLADTRTETYKVNSTHVATLLVDKIGEVLEANNIVGPIFQKIVADPDKVAIAVAIYQNGPARLTGKTLQTLVQDAVMLIVNIFNIDENPDNTALSTSIWGVSIPNLVDDAGVAIPEPPNFGQMLPQVGELVAEKMVLRYNLQDNNKKFNIMDIVQKLMDVRHDLPTYLAGYLGFENYAAIFSNEQLDISPEQMADFFTQKIVMALEQNIPQIMELQYHGKDIKKIVAIYNASPIANGFLNIEGTGTVEEIIQTLLGLITGFFEQLPGTDLKIAALNDQTLAELAVSVSDQIGTNIATRYNLQDGGADPPTIGSVFNDAVKKVKKGLSSYLDDLDFRDELDAIRNGADSDVISTFIADQMGVFLEILVPAFTQVRYYEFVVRPLVEGYNLALGWLLSTQDLIQLGIDAMYQVVKNLPGADFEIPDPINNSIKGFFKDHKDDVAEKFARRYHMHD